MNPETSAVRLINFGSGLRTFEHGLTSTGWSTLSREVGAKTKLSFMSPEQTGRMPAEPDSRTDIYSLGILFWTMLTQQAAFEGETPMDIIQGVLGRRLPTVSSIRLDIPDVVGRIIQKMTAKIIGDRYHSASGLRHDLVEVRTLLGDGNSAALHHWQIATKDVSSFFILPTVMIGRTEEHDEVVKIIDKVSRRHIVGQRQDIHSLSSGSSLSEGRFDAAIGAVADVSSEDALSSAEAQSNSLGRSNSLSHSHGDSNSHGGSNSFNIAGGVSAENRSFKSNSSQLRVLGSVEGPETSDRSSIMLKPWEKNSSLSMDSRSMGDSMNPGGRGHKIEFGQRGELSKSSKHSEISPERTLRSCRNFWRCRSWKELSRTLCSSRGTAERVLCKLQIRPSEENSFRSCSETTV